MEKGLMPIPDGVGLGVEIRMDRVEALTKRRWSL